MLAKRIVCNCILFCLVSLTACTKSPSPITTTTPTPTRTIATVLTVSPSPTLSGTPDATPAHYRSHVLLSGVRRPDDLAFDPRGRLLFSDFYNGTVSRLNQDGSVTVLMSGIAGPEGIVVLSDGTIIIAEQRTNRILALSPGEQSLTILRTLPGTPGTAPC